MWITQGQEQYNALTQEEQELIDQAKNKTYSPDETRENEWRNDQKYLETWEKKKDDPK